MPKPSSVIVIGNGVIGLACAIALRQRGIDVTLVAPHGPARGASWGNAGHIAVEQVAPLASRATIASFPRRLFLRGGAVALPPRAVSAWLPFALGLCRASAPDRFARGKAALGAMLAQAIPAWRRLLDGAGRRDLLLEDGHFVVWETERSAEEGRANWQRSDIGTATIRDATEAELAMLARLTTRPIAGAIRFAGSGQISDLGVLADTLEARFVALGGTRKTGKVARIAAEAGGASVMLDDGTAIRSDAVVVAAGAASADLLKPLGIKAPLIAERGYHIQSAESDWPVGVPPVVFEDRSVIVTRFASGLRAASFVEFARVETPPDPRKWQRLRTIVHTLGLSFPGPVHQWMGARPTLPDYLPAIGRSARSPAICYAFGHQHLGLTLAATTGEAIGAMLCEEPSPFNVEPFDLRRFGRPS